MNEIGVEKQKTFEKEKIEGGKTQGAGKHQRDEVAAEESDHYGADGEGDDSVVHGFVGMPEFQRDKKHDNDGERRVVAFAGLAAHRGEFFLEKEFANHACDAAHGGGPQKIFDADADFLVEIEERRRKPVLRNEQNAGERHRRGDESAPADLGAVVFSKDGTDNPGCPKNEHSDEIGIVIARQRRPPAGEWLEFTPRSSRRKDECYSLNFLLGVACFWFWSSRMSGRES